MSQSDFLSACRAIVGTDYLLCETDSAPDTAMRMADFLTDQRRRHTGRACAIARPANTAQVAALIRLCQQFGVPVVPQGGNTGLVLGGVPDTSGRALVMSLLRMQQIRQIDTINQTMTVEAGCLLAQVQQAAQQVQRLFPLSLGSEGSCSIGGNLSSNAGGTAVLRYGNMRELCLGLEVVTPDGEIWDGLRALRKDNTGYDLRDLYIGAEGTLGIITAAVLKLFPQPASQLTALVALPDVNKALHLLNLAQAACGASLTGFELMSDLCMQLVGRHFPALSSPFASQHAQYVLLELSDHESQAHAQSLLEPLMQAALAQDLISDAVVASSLAQSRKLWQMREHIPLAQVQDGKNIKHDISLPISAIGDFITHTSTLLQQTFPGSRLVCFGHIGDGNLHFNLAAPIGVDAGTFLQHQPKVNQLVHDSVHQYHGSISAEHGIGALKLAALRRYKSPLELKLMRQIKHAFDPHNLMNPGKIFNFDDEQN
jgi:FAD/FMN-containing dehydrogenase